MSRIGKKPIDIPAGVDIKLLDNSRKVKGPKGELQWSLPSGQGPLAETGSLLKEE
jgi:large subunit ribosomal protein L6